MENRYREKNYAYVEFPIRYITKMIDALTAIEKAYYEEEAEESNHRKAMSEELKTARQSRTFIQMI